MWTYRTYTTGAKDLKSYFRPRIPLNGFWRFRVDPNDIGENNGWHKGFESEHLVYVPSSWNEQNPDWDKYVGIAWYQTKFYIGVEHIGKIPWTVFKGCGYYAKIWVNGLFLGDHEGSFIEFRLNALKAVTFGKMNTLVVKIDNKLAMNRIPPGKSVNETAFDFYPYGGIHRDVYVELTNKNYIKDLRVSTDYRGLLKTELTVECCTTLAECELLIKLYDKFFEKEYYACRKNVVGGVIVVEDRLQNIKPWSPEDPQLYNLEVNLICGNEVVDSVFERIGFRSIEVRNNEILLNGKPVFLKGFGRHEDFPVTGKYLPGSVLVRDFYLMKKIGANSFRTSHYPYSEEHLDLADELGFLVILESPFCLSGVGNLIPKQEIDKWCLDPEVRSKAKKMVEEMIYQYKNRPSVIMYSVANEAPIGYENCRSLVRELSEFVKSLNPQTLVTFASHRLDIGDLSNVVDVISLNVYFGWYTEGGDLDKAIARLEKELEVVHQRYPGKPIIITEFGADAITGLHSDPPVMWSEEYQGEFIRRYIEVLIKKPFIKGVHVWNFADFRTPESPLRVILNRKGVVTRDRQPKASYWILQKLFAER